MATSTVNTNKPIIPRGVDDRPVDKYNRAELYSGKALDFDGVNDYVDGGTLDITGYTQMSMSFYFKAHSTTNDWRLISIRYSGSDDIRIFHATSIGAGKLSFALDDGTAVTFSEDFTTNEWYHVVMTHDGTTLKAYFNGVLVQSAASDFNYSGTNGLFYIGRYTGGTFSYYDGEFSNFKLFNTALTAAQVADLYNNPEKVVPTGVSDSALKLWLPMQEGTGTYCINGADPLGDDLFNGAGSFDSATGWTLNTGFSIGGGSLSCDGSQTAATSAYYNISSVASSLTMVQFTLSNVTAGQVQLAFFGASGTTTKWYTSSGTYTEYVEVAAGHNGNTGFIANADFVGDIDNLTLKVVNTGAISGATWTHGIGAPVAQTAVIDWNKETTGAGTTMLLPQGLTSGRDLLGNLFENVRKQGALNLDGNSWAEVHDNASLDITDAITLECWVYFDGSNGKGLLGRWSTGADNNYLLYNSTSSKGQFYINTTAVSLVNTSTLTAGNWYHIVGTYDGSDMRIYLNGSEESNTSKTGSISTSADPIEIGRYYQNSSFAYADQIAQPRIYNRALTAEEVLNNYNATSSLYI